MSGTAASASMSNGHSNADPLPSSSSSSSPQPLLTPFQLGPFPLALRMVYAPLTRCRALGNLAQPAALTYYSQRARAGMLMITESTVVSPDGYGYPNMPGFFTKEHVESWRPIVQAVKAKGAVFFCQLFHVGRVSHPDYMPDGESLPIGPSPIGVSEKEVIYTPKGVRKPVVPREMSKEDIKRVVEDFRRAARAAIDIGFDGVELHGANGYIIDQFLKDGSNKRTDEYGGSPDKRARFALELVQAVVEEVGKERVGLRLAPFNDYLDMSDSDPHASNLALIHQLNDAGGILYIHLIEARIKHAGDVEPRETETIEPLRKPWQGPLIAAGGYTRESGNAAVASGHADLIAFGRLFLANPDLPDRFRLGAPLNKYDRSTFYTFDQVKGYTDYPFMGEGTAIA